MWSAISVRQVRPAWVTARADGPFSGPSDGAVQLRCGGDALEGACRPTDEARL